MKISRHAQELLENLWIYWVYLDGNDDEFIRRNMVEQNIIGELEDLNLVNFVDGNLRLTPEGFHESERIIKNSELSMISEKILMNMPFFGGLSINMKKYYYPYRYMGDLY
jgi:hypothetical protein